MPVMMGIESDGPKSTPPGPYKYWAVLSALACSKDWWNRWNARVESIRAAEGQLKITKQDPKSYLLRIKGAIGRSFPKKKFGPGVRGSAGLSSIVPALADTTASQLPFETVSETFRSDTDYAHLYSSPGTSRDPFPFATSVLRRSPLEER